MPRVPLQKLTAFLNMELKDRADARGDVVLPEQASTQGFNQLRKKRETSTPQN